MGWTFEWMLLKLCPTSEVHICEKKRGIHELQKRYIARTKFPVTAIRGDIFKVVAASKIAYNSVQFDLCGMYTESVHNGLLEAIMSGGVAEEAIISLTLSWNHPTQIQDFLKRVCKDSKIKYGDYNRFRNYGLIELITKLLGERNISIQLLGSVPYKSSLKAHHKGALMNFYLFKIKKPHSHEESTNGHSAGRETAEEK